MALPHPIFPVGAAWSVIHAPAHWRVIDFISDIHLQATQIPTFEAWQDYMTRTRADALFILGDLFEVWTGDDVLTDASSPAAFEVRCQAILGKTAQRLKVFFIPGNRDFLLGPTFADSCGITLLSDPAVLDFDNQRWLLSHGDALCLDDTDYQEFRSLVRGAAWQADFLAKPLHERRTIARSLRGQSQARQTPGSSYANVDNSYARHWLKITQTGTLIHGHTHQPANHTLQAASAANPVPYTRLVLSDWDASASPPRLEVLRLGSGSMPKRIAPDAAHAL